MKISIITVCFNSADTLEKAIKSVIDQDYSDKEYIIVDGGSTDGTVDVIKRYEKHITKWISEPDKGIFDAMNKGISMATGDVIAFLNSDDWYMDSVLSVIGSTFMENDCDCVCCDNFVVTKNGDTKYYDASGFSVEDMYKQMIYYHSAIFAKKKLFHKQNNFNLGYKIAADYDWMLRNVVKGSKIFYLHKPIFTFCYGGVSSVNEVECAREARAIALHYLSKDRQKYLKDINNRYYEIVISQANGNWMNKRLGEVLNLKKPIIIWGAGNRGRQFLTHMIDADIQVMCVVDGDENKWNSQLEHVDIKSPSVLIGVECNLIITPKGYGDEIRQQIDKYKGRFMIYEPEEIWEKMLNIEEMS